MCKKENREFAERQEEVQSKILLKKIEAMECKRKRRKELRNFVLLLLVCVSFLNCFISATVEGESMMPNLYDGDRILCWRHPRQYQQEDIVLLKKAGNRKTYIKRIIGTPGDTLNIVEGVVFRNGEPVIIEGVVQETSRKDGAYPITLGEEEYFVLGDNREISLDSRDFGVVSTEELKGKAWFIYWRSLN